MPNTPSVNINFVNKNVQPSTPQLGISHVLARTTKGPFNRPDEVLSTYAQFQAIYGEEIVPDGTISNIRKAFELGSKLRVSRVAGGDNPSYGYARDYSSVSTGEAAVTNLIFTLKNPANAEESIIVKMAFRTKEQGSAIVDPSSYGLNKDFYLKLTLAEAAKTYISLTQAKTMSEKGDINNNQVLDSRMVISYGTDFIDVATFRDFINNVPNLAVEVVDIVFAPVAPDLANRYKANGAQGIISLLKDYEGWSLTVSGSEDALTAEAPSLYIINEGSNGGNSTQQTWEDAYDAIASYDDAYAVGLSHVHQHLDEYTEVYKAIADKMIHTWDAELYVEVPKSNEDGTPRTEAETRAALKTLVNTIGQNKAICYFGGGIKYYDDSGVIRNCDVLGTVLGLGDTAASNYGPWYSFAGMTRGIVGSALGPVMENLGSSNKKNILQEFAEWYMNLFLIKDTRYAGKRTMLWHSFTSHPKSDSFKFLSVARLSLYIKKNIRPILESYIEEPNIWGTWKNIYYEVKSLMDDLVDRQAITEYVWMGDQDAQSYSDLAINNEADVRAGKYHIVLKYKDVVTLQEITLDVVTDSATGSIEISE